MAVYLGNLMNPLDPQAKQTASDAPAQDARAITRDAASPYPLSRLAARIDLVDVAREIQAADAILGVATNARLGVIASQIRHLQEEARRVLEEAELAARLHRATCNFVKRPGHTYHFYRRDGGDTYLSMLSPHDWGGAPPHAYEGSYRLELDMSWTLVHG